MANGVVSLAQKHDISILYILISVVLIGGLAYSLFLGDTFRISDERNYYAIGGYLASQHQFTLNGSTSTAGYPPGYPVVISFLRKAGAGVFGVRFLNFICLALSIYVLFHILQLKGHSLAGVFAGFLVLGYPVLFFTAGTLLPQTVGSLLFLFTILMFVRNQNWPQEMALAGLAYGFLILTIPYFLTLMPFMAFIPWILGLNAKGRRAALFAAICLCIVGGWTLRNYAVFSRFIPVSTQSGINMLAGNSENATANSGISADISRYKLEAQKFKGDEVAIDKFYRQKAWEWMTSHKVQALKLYLLKCLNYFNYRNELATASEASRFRDLVMLATYGPLLLLFLIRVGLAKYYPFSRLEFMFIGLYFLNVFPSAIFYTRIRYRLPFDFLLIALVGLFLAQLLSRRAGLPGDPRLPRQFV